MVLAIYLSFLALRVGLRVKNMKNDKNKGRRKSALLQDAPLKLPPDWRNWLTPIAVFLLSAFYRWILFANLDM